MAEPRTSLPIARYGEVMAHVIHFRRAPRGAVLAALGVEPDDWEVSDATWRKALVDEAIEDERPVTAAFRDAMTPVLAQLKAERPALDTVARLPPEAPSAVGPVEGAPANEPAPASEASPLPVEATPTYLIANARNIPSLDVVATDGEPPRPVTPEASSGAVAPPAAGAPPPLTLQQYGSLCAEVAVFPDRTEAIFHKYGLGDLRDRRAADVSWQERLRRNPAEYQGWYALYQRWTEHFERLKAGGGLLALEEGKREVATRGLGAPPHARPRELYDVADYLEPDATPAPLALLPLAARPADDLARTAMAFELPTALRPKPGAALPFQAGGSSSMATPSPDPRRPSISTAGETIGLGVDLIAQMRGTLPFGRPGAAAAPIVYPRMPLQTYASFCAELAAFPEKAAEILAKYHVSGEPARAALVQEWQTRLDAHADVKADWQELVNTFRAGLLRQPG